MSLFMKMFFLILEILFALLKEKSVLFISGLNTMTLKQQNRYDKKRIVIDQIN